jgi:hypothetical protein
MCFVGLMRHWSRHGGAQLSASPIARRFVDPPTLPGKLNTLFNYTGKHKTHEAATQLA